jgi:hypothetical protein
LEEPEITTVTDMNECDKKNELTPQERFRNAMKNVSMNVELDHELSESAKGTMNNLSVDGK